MPIGGVYETGTVSIDATRLTVTGLGTFWSPIVTKGDWLLVGGQVGLVESVTSETVLQLQSLWQGTLPVNSDYVIIKNSWERYDPALTQAKLRELLEELDAQGNFLFVEGDEPDPAMGEDGQWALKTDVTPWQLWYKDPLTHTWVGQAPPAGLHWRGTWDSGASYIPADAVERLGSSYVSKTNNNNQAPEVNSDDWDLMASGAVGPPGPQGPEGMRWTGPWSSATVYGVDDAVERDGSSYIAVLVNGPSAVPPPNANWNLLAAAGVGGGGGGGASISIADVPPVGASAGDLWWESDTGALWVYYIDASGPPTEQWVEAGRGGINSTTQAYVDNAIDGRVAVAGDTMTGKLVANAGLDVFSDYFTQFANLQTVPVGTAGMSIGWNFSNGGAEVDFFSLTSTALESFRFIQKTGASTTNKLMTIEPTGNVNVFGDLKVDKASARFTLNKNASGQSNDIVGTTLNVVRWALTLGDIVAESGATGGVGSHLNIDRYGNDGAYLGRPLSISRETGRTTLDSSLVFSGDGALSRSVYSIWRRDTTGVLGFTGGTGGYQWNNSANNFGLMVLSDVGLLTVNGSTNVAGPMQVGTPASLVTPRAGQILSSYNVTAGSVLGLNSYLDDALVNWRAHITGPAGQFIAQPDHILVRFNASVAANALQPFPVAWSFQGDGYFNTAGIICGRVTQSTVYSAATMRLGYSGTGIAIRPATDASNAMVFLNAADTFVGYIHTTATNTAYATASDERLKEDLKSFDAGNIVDNTNVYDFKWKSTGERAYGILAQQAVEVYPTAVSHIEETDDWGIDYSKYVPVLLQELKAVRARLAELEGKVGIAATPAKET